MYSSGIYNFKVALGSLMNSDLKLQNYVKIEYGNGKLNDTAFGNRNWEEKVGYAVKYSIAESVVWSQTVWVGGVYSALEWNKKAFQARMTWTAEPDLGVCD